MRLAMPCYKNTLVYRLGMEEEKNIELFLDVPTRINALFENGEVDLALISSIKAKNCHLLPFGIFAKEKISSVNLYLKEGIDLSKTVIGITRESATSKALLLVLAHHFWKIPLTFETLQEKPYDAFLLIGDSALKLNPPSGFRKMDLAAEWYKYTHLPFVFAIFASHKNEDYSSFLQRVLSSGEKKLKSDDPYFKLLHYRFSQREFDAFSLFHKLYSDV